MANKNQSHRGFTLIELMIAVSIIGILAGLAIANFSRYESRARQGEAKIALAAIYAAEVSFKSEWGAFMEDLRAIGYVPEGFKRHYTVGWRSPTVPDAVSNYTGPVGQPNYDFNNIPTSWWTDEAGNIQCDLTAARFGLTDSVATSLADLQVFTVRARGVLRRGQRCDEWEINQEKNLRNTNVNL